MSTEQHRKHTRALAAYASREDAAVTVLGMNAANDTVALTMPAGNPMRKQSSLLVLILVIAAHLLLLWGVIKLSQMVQLDLEATEPTPMLVSLVSEVASAPEPAPEVVEIVPPPPPPKPKPVIKKQKPAEVIPEPVVKEVPVVNESVATPSEQVAEPIAEQPVASPSVAAAEQVAAAAPKETESVAQDVVEPPKFGAAYLHNPPPQYPVVSRRIGEEGRVLLRVLVSKKGDAEQVEIETGSGSTRLDKAAMDAVKKWRFIPAKRNNEPISAFVIVPIQFTLNS
jgi:periplasmic protein TonB